MLLSKRPEMFLPDHWPAYFSRTYGAHVWDMDGTGYIDMYLMGVGTNILGYSHPEVDTAVSEIVQSGNLSTLNAPEEVYLAERLTAMHPFAEMARFCRSGGEANAVAVRIARAASGRSKVAFCGYHGWHDWYLAANLSQSAALDAHLLPGLDPIGVPQELTGLMRSFAYNNIEEFDAAVSDPQVGTIFMEVSRNLEPAPEFLEHIRSVADRKGVVLIFDECTSGFRETFGGLHLKYGVEPDIAVFGKTIGNGYAITAIIGTRAVMEAAQSTFISSTFWTERIGPAAALKTLDVMERERSWEKITETGAHIRARWSDLAEEFNLSLTHWGLPSLCGFTINSQHSQIYKTLITQEMLKQKYLAGNSVYVSLAHTEKIINGYFDALTPIWERIMACEVGTQDVNNVLEGPIAHSGFGRLN